MSEGPTRALPSEVGAGQYLRRAGRRWYVVLLTVVVAVAVVFLHGVSAATRQSAATAVVYLGAPYNPTGTNVLPSSPLSNSGIAIGFVEAPQQISAAANAAGIDHRNLRDHVSILPVGGAINGGKNVTPSPTPTMSITVEGPWTRIKVQKAVNSLAQQLIDYANRYSSQKTTLMKAKVASERKEMATLLDAQAQTHKNLARLDGSSASQLDKVAAAAPYVGTLAASIAQVTAVSVDMTNDQLGLLGSRDIESAQFITHGAGHRLAAATRRASILVAALIGIVLGIALALAWESLAAARQTRAA